MIKLINVIFIFIISFSPEIVIGETETIKQDQKDIVEYRINAAKKIFFSNGMYSPSYKKYLNDPQNYELGFNDGMILSISMDRNDGTDHKLKEAIKSIKQKSKSYSIGFYSALESYSAISKYIYTKSK